MTHPHSLALYTHRLFTPPVHTACSHRLFTPPVHPACAHLCPHRLFTPWCSHVLSVHTCGRRQASDVDLAHLLFTPPVHTACSHRLFTPPVHTACSHLLCLASRQASDVDRLLRLHADLPRAGRRGSVQLCEALQMAPLEALQAYKEKVGTAKVQARKINMV